MRSDSSIHIYLYCLSRIIHISNGNAHSPRVFLCMCAQVSYAHGWHGAQKTALANKQQKQQQPQKQKQKQKQKQDKKQKQKQKQEQKQEQEQNGGGETGALAADGVEARMSQPLRTHAQTHLV